jgi:hypothetical protein
MAISRPFLLALLGVLLLGATVLAVQNARTTSDGDTAPAALQTQPAPAPTDTATAAGPAETLKSAFNFGKLESARFDARLGFGARSGSGSFAVSGSFDTAGAGAVPAFDVVARVRSGGRQISGGLVSLGDKAYFVRGDAGWRVPREVWGPLVEQLSAGGGAAQAQAPLGLHPATWVRDVKSEGTERVSGVETEHVSARVDPAAVANDLAQAARQNGGEAPDLGAVSRAVKRADIDVWVGTDDQILRRLSAVLAFQGGRLRLDVRLSDVNKPQQIEAPAQVRAGAPAGSLGQLAQGLVGGINGMTGADTAPLAVLTSPNPRRAARGVRNHKKVVILFRNPRGLDDRAMAAVMRNVDSRTEALVLTDHVDAVERYGKLVEDLGVSQTPSVVLIDRSGKARLLEGFTDSDTLTQAVADAR